MCTRVNTLHSCTRTHTSLLLPFWYQGRNQGQGTLAVLLGIVSGQHENLSKVRLQTSSAEGQGLLVLLPHPLSVCQGLHWPLCSIPHPAGTLCWLLCPIPIVDTPIYPISAGPCPHPRPAGPQGTEALTCGGRQAAHVALALLAVLLPPLNNIIRDLGRGTLWAPGSITHHMCPAHRGHPAVPGTDPSLGTATGECRLIILCHAMPGLLDGRGGRKGHQLLYHVPW